MKFNRIISILCAVAVVFTSVFGAVAFSAFADIPTVQVETFKESSSAYFERTDWCSLVTEADGNVALKLDFAVQYAYPHVRLNNIILKPNTTYNYSFVYKTENGMSINGNKGLKLGAYKDVSNWRFWFDTKEENCFEKNLLGTNVNTDGFRTDSAPIQKTDTWELCSGTFSTDAIVDDTYKYLGFFCQAANSGWALYIDDVILTEITNPAATTGNVVVNNGDSIEIHNDVSTYCPEDLTTEGFVAWCTDKLCKNVYGGTVAANTTVMLYPGYGTLPPPAEVEVFNDEKSIFDVYGFVKVEDGAAHFYAEKSYYSMMGCRFNNLLLKPNTNYSLNFKIKGKIPGINKGPFVLAAQNVDSWKYWTSGSEKMEQFNLLGTEVDTNGYRTQKLSLTVSEDIWTQVSVSFSTDTLVTENNNHLGIMMQALEGKNYDFYIDDIVLTPVTTAAGNLALNDGQDGFTYLRNIATATPAAPETVKDKTFIDWYTDKDLTVKFDGNVPAGTTTMLYAAYDEKLPPAKVEMFNAANSLFDSYSIAKAEDGAAHFYVENSRYDIMGCRFTNLELQPNTNYTLNFKIMGKMPGLNKGAYIIAARNVDNWKYWTTGASNMQELNLLGTDVDGSGYRTQKLSLSVAENKWTQISVSFSTGTIVTKDNNHLGIMMQAVEGKTYDFCIDDVILTPESESVGNLVLNDGSGNLKFLENVSAVTLEAPTVESEKPFSGWYIDKDCYMSFDGVVPAGTTTMVYAAFGDKDFAERFTDGLRDVQTGGEFNYEILTESDGNKYLHATASNDWSRFLVRFKKLELKPNTKYVVNYRYKCEKGTRIVKGPYVIAGRDVSGWMFWTQGAEILNQYNLLGDTVDNNGYKNTAFSFNLSSGWVDAALIIDTTGIVDDTWKYLTFGFQCSEKNTYDFSFDDISVTEISEEDLGRALINGDFENGKAMWNDSHNVSEIIDNDVRSGERALSVSGGYMAKVSQSMFLEKNQSYKLTFYYKGYGSGIPNWAISKLSPYTTKDYLVQLGSFPTVKNEATDWTQVSAVFNTGDNDLFYFFLQSDCGSKFTVDDITVEKTVESVTPALGTTDPIASTYATVNYDGCQRSYTYVCNESKNLLGCTGFENIGTWAQDSLLSNGYLSAAKTDVAFGGDYALRFESYEGDKSLWNTMYFNVEPNTLYYLTAYIRMDKWSEKDKNDMRMAFIDPYTGTAVSESATANSPLLASGGPDEKWHLLRLSVNTGSRTCIGIGFNGAASGGYIDDLMFFKSSDAVKVYPATYDTMLKECSISGPEAMDVANKYCDDSKNLIGDSTCDKETYWQNIYGYGDVKYGGGIEIADTNGSYGKAIHCVEDLSFTGYAKQNYMRTALEVEPNTEYTVHFDYLIEKSGNGEVGLYANGVFYPENFLSYKFGGEDVTLHKWNDVSVTFNTNDYSSIVFYVMNGGGEAWIDNVRVFKASDGKSEGSKPVISQKITSNSLSINNGILSGMTEGSSISDVLNRLNEKDNIVVLRDGILVPESEYSKPFTYDLQFKLTDGVAYVDSVALSVKGDVNRDYKFDRVDADMLLKILTKQIDTNAYSEITANVDGQENISINDAVRMYANINLGDPLK